MRFEETPLKGNFLITPNKLNDNRGWFSRTFCKEEFTSANFSGEWVQMNHSFTITKGTIRGMHFQTKPHSEVKLVRCISGAVFDVAVDLREGSPTFLKWFGAEISSTNMRMMYIPVGFAHGFQALEQNSELLYLHSNYFTPSAEAGIRYDDPLLSVQWPLPAVNISDRDQGHAFLNKNFLGI